VIYKKYVEVAH